MSNRLLHYWIVQSIQSKKGFFSFVQPGLSPLQSITEISGYKIEKLFINIMEGFLNCLLLEAWFSKQ